MISEKIRMSLAASLKEKVVPRENAKRRAQNLSTDSLAHLIRNGPELSPPITAIEMEEFVKEARIRIRDNH